MPKRKIDNLEVIVNKLRKLEKEVKRSRRYRRSSSSSSEPSSRSSSSSPSSRAPSPAMDNQECQEPVINPEVDTINLEPESTPPNETTAGLSDILGEDPTATAEYGPDINTDLAARLAHIATSGLNKDTRIDLLKKFLVPANCENISAPKLNVEIKAAIPETATKRDKCIESRQKIIAAGITALGGVISRQLESKNKDNDLIKDLMDVARLLCDIQHAESETRRNFALYSVKKELKDQLSLTEIDKCLFGSDFAETLKTAKAVSKSSTDLKRDFPKKSPPAANPYKKDLNWKPRTGARRQQPVTQTRPQSSAAPSATPRGSSSRNYRQRRRHHKQNRRD
ncbi:uncharacterized protein LOC132902317 [Amyelois transitella]|uniref:uncharacterized protein LOC132902317 n=1 Tax=Amyelois transitella TaxID=680683 RepID=UPI0029907FF3|nr:uncharacterized protein LOC132902317 [Amyelois transitella]